MNMSITKCVQEFEEEYEFLNTVSLMQACELREGEEDVIAAQYEAAMTRRRSYVCDLANHIYNCDVRIHRYRRSYLVGYENEGVFIISHFAPYSMREGVEMMKRLGMAVAAVTPDLSGMLQKCGWSYHGTIPQWFAGEICKKDLWSKKLRGPKLQKLLREM